jgi:predicted Zn-dependent peptidase
VTPARGRTPSTRPARRARARTPRGFTSEPAPLRGGVVLRALASSGTPVAIRPMPGFRKAYAVLAVRFGSLDTALPDGRPLPLGLAHFLEHKMFATPTGDVFDLYARRGAGANAYTTYGWTAYLFQCASRFDENLVTLLDTVRTMHADPAGIEREKGVIGQEIAMYDDDAGWRSRANLLAALYRDHPIRHEITGSAATIAAIDRDVLVATHAAYYHPRNLALFVAGDVVAEDVLSLAGERLATDAPGAAHRRAPRAEPAETAALERREALSVSRPLVTLGMKDAAPGPRTFDAVRRETETGLAMDVLFGDGGRVEAPLYRDGVVDGSLHADYHAEEDAAFATVGAEVDDEAAFRARLEEDLERAARAPIGEAEVERSRRRSVGAWLRAFDAPGGAASLLLSLHARDTTPADAVRALETASAARVTERARDLLARPRAWSVVVPRGETAPAAPAVSARPRSA